MRLWSALKYDIKFQIRHGFYYAYTLVSLLYIIMLRLLPISIREYTATLVLFSDPSVLGFFFIGGIVLLEKGQNIFESLFVTPIRAWEYLASKLISLTLLSVISSLVIAVFSFGISFNPFPMILGVILSSVFFTLIGFTLAFLSKTLNHYISLSLIYVPIFILPVIGFLGIFDTTIFNLLPAKPGLILIQGAFKGLEIGNYIYYIIVLVVWIIIAGLWVNDWFYKYVILRIGGGSK